MNNVKTGQFILSCRKELGLTQNQLAEKLNVTDKAISKWENGKSAPDIATLVPLAETLGVSVVEILNGKRMEQVELQAEADFTIVDTMKKSKKKVIDSVICAVLVVLFLFSLVPAYHYYSTISVENMDAIIEKAYASGGDSFKNYEKNRMLKCVNKGDYMVLLIESPTNVSDVIFVKDELFKDRYRVTAATLDATKGDVHVTAFGENGMSVNVLYGVDIPREYTKYTFGYRNYQYICPIEDGVVLDVFIDVGGFTNAYEVEMLE